MGSSIARLHSETRVTEGIWTRTQWCHDIQECADRSIVPYLTYLPSERLLGLACSQEDNAL